MGDILGGASGVIKWNPKTVLVPSAVVATISGGLLAIVTFFMERAMLAAGRPGYQRRAAQSLVMGLTQIPLR